MRAFCRTLRICSAITLFFFCWTYMPIYAAIAWAAEPQVRTMERADRLAPSVYECKSASAGCVGVKNGNTVASVQRPEDRFEKALEEIREKVGKAGEKAAKGQDASTEIETIKAKKAEIISLDVELKKEFIATEKKLKDARLPKEILDRHYKFVKHYKDNFAELKTNLSAIEKPSAKSRELQAALQKAKLHLEKTKPPKKHVPLDPNKLPFRSVKAKERAPRLKKEEFERDFGPQKRNRLAADERRVIGIETNWKEVAAGFSLHEKTTNHSVPVLAYNSAIASDMPLQLPFSSQERTEMRGGGFDLWTEATALPSDDSLNPSVISATSYEPPATLLAQAVDLPTSADLAETPEVQFTDDIKNLAEQLNNSPVKIYEWIRNNIEFVPSYGSIQGADMCLQSRQCNAIDTASLLIALLRTSNRPARYVYGTVEIPIEKVMNWAGGFTDPMAAATFIASGGIRGRLVISGGKPAKIQMEHVWVETHIPYGNYRGAIMDNSIKTWIPMDGSYNQYTYTNGFDMTATVPFSQDEYLSQVQSQNAVHYYQGKIQEYLDANMPGTSIINVKGCREITPEIYHFLPSTLPYITVAQLGKSSSIPDGMKAKITFAISNPGTGFSASYTVTSAEIAGKRITVSYNPATGNDEALINNYGGYIYGVPAYMLNLIPVLRIQGDIKLSGDAVMMGSEQTLTIQFSQPAANLNETVQKRIIAGTYYAVGLDLQGMNETVVGKRNNSLTANVLSESAGTLGKDEFIGEYLYIRALTYFYANDKIYKSGAKLYNTAITRTLSESITSFPLSVTQFFGIAKSVSPAGVEIDVAMDRIIAVSRSGDANKERAYMDIAGLVSSYHEHSLFENIDGYASVSAVRALQVASANSIVIHNINLSNIDQILPTLNVAPEIKTDIQNAINAGKEVTVPQTNIQIDDWQGVGYIVKDTLTGSGSYIISGGLHGGSSTSSQSGQKVAQAFMSVVAWVVDVLSYALGGTIAEAAMLEEGEVGLSEQEIQEKILYGTMLCASYVGIGMCTGLVVKAYYAAGIDLVGLGRAYKTGDPNYSPNLYKLAATLSLKSRVRMNNDPAPIKGDIIFWRYTNDRNKSCILGDDEQPTHVGIVEQFSDDGTVLFVHAGNSGVTHGKKMNITNPSSTALNAFLTNRWNKCKVCTKPAECPATDICKAGTVQINKCPLNDWEDYGHLAGQLFYGYTTIRNSSYQIY